MRVICTALLLALGVCGAFAADISSMSGKQELHAAIPPAPNSLEAEFNSYSGVSMQEIHGMQACMNLAHGREYAFRIVGGPAGFITECNIHTTSSVWQPIPK